MFMNNTISHRIFSITTNYIDKNKIVDIARNFQSFDINDLDLLKIMLEIEAVFNVDIEKMYFSLNEYSSLRNFIEKMTTYIEQR